MSVHTRTKPPRLSDLVGAVPYDPEREDEMERQALAAWRSGADRRGELAYEVSRWLVWLGVVFLVLVTAAWMRAETNEGGDCGEFDGVPPAFDCGASVRGTESR